MGGRYIPSMSQPSNPQAFAIFDTAIGDCALIWGEAGIVGAMLPESRVRERIARRFPEAVERWFVEADAE